MLEQSKVMLKNNNNLKNVFYMPSGDTLFSDDPT